MSSGEWKSKSSPRDTDPNEQELQAIREGIEEADADMGQPLAEFDADFRKRNGLAPRDQS
jgi:hypothetical protein